MGVSTQYECDKCGLQVSIKYYFPDGWRYIKIQRYEHASYHTEDCWLLCKVCVTSAKRFLPESKPFKF